MAVICPTITAYDLETYNEQIKTVRSFAKRIHIDLMDGQFAPTVSPPLDRVWWPHHLEADIHLMYQKPGDYIMQLTKLKPRMVIIHAEAEVDHMHFAAQLHKHDIEAGLAVLAGTAIESVQQIMHSFDQVLIFSGNLGHHGGTADLSLLDRATYIKAEHPEAEIAWDGGINHLNAQKIVEAGVDVLNVGSFIHQSIDPESAFNSLRDL